MMLTRLKRSTDCSELEKLLFLLPVTISRIITPKLNASDLTEYCPRMAYSGAMYPLKIIGDDLVMNLYYVHIMPCHGISRDIYTYYVPAM